MSVSKVWRQGSLQRENTTQHVKIISHVVLVQFLTENETFSPIQNEMIQIINLLSFFEKEKEGSV